MRLVAIRIFEHVSAAPTEHTAFPSVARANQAHGRSLEDRQRTQAEESNSSRSQERILDAVALLQHLIFPRAHERYCDRQCTRAEESNSSRGQERM